MRQVEAGQQQVRIKKAQGLEPNLKQPADGPTALSFDIKYRPTALLAASGIEAAAAVLLACHHIYRAKTSVQRYASTCVAGTAGTSCLPTIFRQRQALGGFCGCGLKTAVVP